MNKYLKIALMSLSLVFVMAVIATTVVTDKGQSTLDMNVSGVFRVGSGSTTSTFYEDEGNLSVFNEEIIINKGDTNHLIDTINATKLTDGRKIKLPCGKWYINTSINITELNNTWIQGSGTCTILVLNNSQQIFLHENGDLTNFEISNMRWDKERTDDDLSSSRYIRLAGDLNSNIKIHHITTIHKNASHTPGSIYEYAPSFGIQLNSCTNCHIYKNTLINYGWYPLESEGGQDISITDNYIRTSYYGISGGGNSQRRLRIINNNIGPTTTTVAFTYGIFFENTAGEFFINKNYIENSTGSGGIRLANVNGQTKTQFVSITDNTIINSDYPLDISNQSYVKIVGNTIPNWNGHNEILLDNNLIVDIGHNFINKSITFDFSRTNNTESNWYSNLNMTEHNLTNIDTITGNVSFDTINIGEVENDARPPLIIKTDTNGTAIYIEEPAGAQESYQIGVDSGGTLNFYDSSTRLVFQLSDNPNPIRSRVLHQMDEGLTVGDGSVQKNITMTSGDGTEGCCGMNDDLTWGCREGAC